MRSNYKKAVTKVAQLAIAILLGVGVSFAQSVGLTAIPQNIVLPDGNSVPMWGLVCGTNTTAAVGSAVAAPTGGVTCATANPNAGANWSPVVITVPPGSLTINFANSLSFTTPSGGTNTVPTSLV